jgi:hypothetical protein
MQKLTSNQKNQSIDQRMHDQRVKRDNSQTISTKERGSAKTIYVYASYTFEENVCELTK